MKIPSVFGAALIAAILTLIAYLRSHVGEFGLNDLYIPVAVTVLDMFAKMIQERSTPQAAARGVSEEHGFWRRVLTQ